MSETIHGRILSVSDEPVGDFLASAVIATDVALPVEDLSPFSEDGGQVSITDPDTGDEILNYTGYDATTLTLTGVDALTYGHAAGVRVDAYPAQVDRIATVQLDDLDQEPIPARVPHSLRLLLPEGQRSDVIGDDDTTALPGEEVLVRYLRYSWIVEDVIGQTAALNSDEVTLPSTDGSPPASSPAASVAVPNIANALHVTWTEIANDDPVTYDVYRHTSSPFTPPGTGTLVASIAGTSFVDTAATGGAPYYYRIIARDADGSAAPGTVGSATPVTFVSDDSPPGSSPAAIVSVPNIANTLEIRWVEVSNNDPVTYDVYRHTSSPFTPPGTGTLVASISGTAFTDTGVDGGTPYYYRIIARDADGSAAVGTVGSGTPLTYTSDGSAPASSPTVTVIPGFRVLHLRWDGTTNADPVTYEVHVATTGASFTPSASTLAAETDATAFTLKADADEQPLGYSTTYYVRLISKDVDGSASAGTAGSGVPLQVGGGDIVAGSITADHISTLLLESSSIITGTSGRRIELDVDGLRVYDQNDNPVVTLPTSGGETSRFEGSVTATELTVTDNSTFRNTGTYDIGSVFRLADKVADPSVGPTVTSQLQGIYFDVGARVLNTYRRGLWWDGSAYWYIYGLYDVSSKVYAVNVNSAGVVQSATALSAISGAGSVWPVGIVKVGSYWYSLVYGALWHEYRWVVFNDSAGVPGSVASTTAWSAWNGQYDPAIATDGTNIIVAQSNLTPTGGSSTANIAVYTTPGTGAAPSLSSSINTVDNLGSSSIKAIWRGSADFGANRYLIRDAGLNYFYAVNVSTGASIAADRFYAPGDQYDGGIVWDGSNFQVMSQSAEVLWKFSGWDTGTSAATTYQFAYAWNDSDGTQHESGLSPRSAVSVYQRYFVTVKWPTIPDGGDPDDPNSVNVYAVQSGSDPGSSFGSYFEQAMAQTGKSVTLSSYASITAGMQGTPFAVGAAATLETQSAGMKLKGDGTFIMPVFTSTQRNAISSPEQGRMLFDSTVGAFYVFNGDIWMPFGGFLGAQVPKNSDQNISNGINVNEVVTFAGTNFDTGVTDGSGTNDAFFSNADDAFIVPTGAAGMYEVLAVVEWAIPGANCDARAKVWLGGTVSAGVVSGGTGAIATKDARLLTAGQQASIVLPFTVELAEGDVVRVAVGQNSGGALAVKGDGTTKNTYFEIKYLGPKHA